MPTPQLGMPTPQLGMLTPLKGGGAQGPYRAQWASILGPGAPSRDYSGPRARAPSRNLRIVESKTLYGKLLHLNFLLYLYVLRCTDTPFTGRSGTLKVGRHGKPAERYSGIRMGNVNGPLLSFATGSPRTGSSQIDQNQ